MSFDLDLGYLNNMKLNFEHISLFGHFIKVNSVEKLQILSIQPLLCIASYFTMNLLLFIFISFRFVLFFILIKSSKHWSKFLNFLLCFVRWEHFTLFNTSLGSYIISWNSFIILSFLFLFNFFGFFCSLLSNGRFLSFFCFLNERFFLFFLFLSFFCCFCLSFFLLFLFLSCLLCFPFCLLSLFLGFFIFLIRCFKFLIFSSYCRNFTFNISNMLS